MRAGMPGENPGLFIIIFGQQKVSQKRKLSR